MHFALHMRRVPTRNELMALINERLASQDSTFAILRMSVSKDATGAFKWHPTELHEMVQNRQRTCDGENTTCAHSCWRVRGMCSRWRVCAFFSLFDDS